MLLFAILHHLNDKEDPGGIVARIREALAPGSYLAISSFRMPGPEHPEGAAKTAAMEKLFNEKLGTGRWRDHDEILGWFGDWELLEPGLVPLPEWRPAVTGSSKRNATYYGFVGASPTNPDQAAPARGLPDCSVNASAWTRGEPGPSGERGMCVFPPKSGINR